jgi:hypothetical protein
MIHNIQFWLAKEAAEFIVFASVMGVIFLAGAGIMAWSWISEKIKGEKPE